MYLTGKDLRNMRLEAGLTTVQMATLAKVKTRKTYENWERDIGSPNMNQFIAICIGCRYQSHTIIKMAVERVDKHQQLNLVAAAQNYTTSTKP